MNRIITAVILSLLCPGLGQFYNRDFKKGTAVILLTIVFFLLPSFWIVLDAGPQLAQFQGQTLTPELMQPILLEVMKKNAHGLQLVSFAFLGTWAYAITQAYFKAKEMTTDKDADNLKDDSQS